MVHHSDKRIALVLDRVEEKPCVCSGCGKVHHTPVHSVDAVIIEDLPMSGKRMFLHIPKRRSLCHEDERIRKEQLRKARQQENKELTAVLHCNKRFILMQNKVTDKKTDILKKLESLNERVYQSMLQKEQFLSVYAAGNRKDAYTNLREWIVAAIKSGIPSFVELGYKFFRKRHYVLNYFVCKITSAISEGINNKIKRLKRMAYGYRDVKYFLLKIHQHCGLLSPKLST